MVSYLYLVRHILRTLSNEFPVWFIPLWSFQYQADRDNMGSTQRCHQGTERDYGSTTLEHFCLGPPRVMIPYPPAVVFGFDRSYKLANHEERCQPINSVKGSALLHRNDRHLFTCSWNIQQLNWGARDFLNWHSRKHRSTFAEMIS